VKIIPGDADVGEAMVRPCGIDEVPELTPMFDGDDDLPETQQDGTDGLADQ